MTLGLEYRSALSEGRIHQLKWSTTGSQASVLGLRIASVPNTFGGALHPNERSTTCAVETVKSALDDSAASVVVTALE